MAFVFNPFTGTFDNVASGTAAGLSIPSPTPILAFRMVATDSAGNAVYADASNIAHARTIVGISKADSTTNVTAFDDVIVDNPAWNWMPESLLLLGLNGEITDDPEVGVFALPVGHAVTPTKVNIRIGTPVKRA